MKMTRLCQLEYDERYCTCWNAIITRKGNPPRGDPPFTRRNEKGTAMRKENVIEKFFPGNLKFKENNVCATDK